jgi:hypothetical protein
MALPDADMSTATDSRIPSNTRLKSPRTFSARHFPCCLRAELCPVDSARLAAVPQLLYKTERFYGVTGFTVLLKRIVLIEENRCLFLDLEASYF